MLDALKRELKDLLGAGRLEDLFKRLRSWLRGGVLRNEIILPEAKFQATKAAGELDLIDPSGQRTAFGQINYALLERSDDILLDDLGLSLRRQADTHVSIPAYHGVPLRPGGSKRSLQRNGARREGRPIAEWTPPLTSPRQGTAWRRILLIFSALGK